MTINYFSLHEISVKRYVKLNLTHFCNLIRDCRTQYKLPDARFPHFCDDHWRSAYIPIRQTFSPLWPCQYSIVAAIHDPCGWAYRDTTFSRIWRTSRLATRPTSHAATTYVYCASLLTFVVMIPSYQRAFAHFLSNRGRVSTYRKGDNPRFDAKVIFKAFPWLPNNLCNYLAAPRLCLCALCSLKRNKHCKYLRWYCDLDTQPSAGQRRDLLALFCPENNV